MIKAAENIRTEGNQQYLPDKEQTQLPIFTADIHVPVSREIEMYEDSIGTNRSVC